MTEKNKKMSFIGHIILCVVVITLFFINPVYADFGNGDFETGAFSPWAAFSNYGGQSLHSDYANNSDYGVKIYTDHVYVYNYGYAGIRQYTTLTDNNYLSWDMKIDDYNNPDPTNITVKFRIKSNTNQYIFYEVQNMGTSGWQTYEVGLNGQSGSHNMYFEVYVNAPTGPYIDVWLDNIHVTENPVLPSPSSIDFNPNYNITNSSAYPTEDYIIGNDDVPDNEAHQVYYVKLYSYKWINETWDSKTLYQWGIKGEGMQTKVDINYNTDPSGNINRGTFVHFGLGDYFKIQTELVNPFIGVLATDSYIYDNRIDPPGPLPTPDPTPDPTPSSTPTPEPTATPQPDPEPINQTLNTSFVHGYTNLVNNTMDGFFVPMYNFSDYIAQPLTSLNYTLCNFTVEMNNSFNTTSVNLGISTNILFIIMSGFPQKIINLIGYYLTWIIILMIFKGET